MRIFFTGPRIFGIRPGISFGQSDFNKARRPPPLPRGAGFEGVFVYVIEGADNKHKIGISTDPIARIAQLQTGSPTRLDFAYIGVTQSRGIEIEQAAHRLLDDYRHSGEWFGVPASIAIGSVIEASRRLGVQLQQVPAELVPQVIAAMRRPQTPSLRPRKLGPVQKILNVIGVICLIMIGIVVIALMNASK